MVHYSIEKFKKDCNNLKMRKKAIAKLQKNEKAKNLKF